MSMSEKFKKVMKNYSILAPIIRKNIKKEEEKLGRKFTKEERNQFIEKDRKSLRTRIAVTAGAFSLGVALGAGATKALPEPKDKAVAIEQTTDKEEEKENEFKTGLHATVKENPNKDVKKEEKNVVIEDIINDYNTRFDKDIEKDDVGILKVTPNFIRRDINTR